MGSLRKKTELKIIVAITKKMRLSVYIVRKILNCLRVPMKNE